MNKQGKISWTNYTWNPIVGCSNDCWYCYAKRLAQRFPKNFPNDFEPTFYPDRLDQPTKVKKPSKIFVCSVSDLFAPWTRDKWREAVLRTIEECPVKHTFQLLTKQPQEIDKKYKFPDNVWVGATVNLQSEISKIEEMKKVKAKVKFISFEPLLGKIDADLSGIDWVIIGKLTGSKKVELERDWVKAIVKEVNRQKIPLFLKNNLYPFCWWMEKRQEFPRVPCESYPAILWAGYGDTFKERI